MGGLVVSVEAKVEVGVWLPEGVTYWAARSSGSGEQQMLLVLVGQSDTVEGAQQVLRDGCAALAEALTRQTT